jgi:hypothetical protein
MFWTFYLVASKFADIGLATRFFQFTENMYGSIERFGFRGRFSAEQEREHVHVSGLF